MIFELNAPGDVHATYARMWDTGEMVSVMTKLRLTNIDNRHDRGSYRMRYIAGAFLRLVGRAKPKMVFCGAALSRACAFGVITGGLAMCTLVQSQTFSFIDQA